MFVSDIKCRCAYLVDVVTFSRVLSETVTIVIPLPNLICSNHIPCIWYIFCFNDIHDMTGILTCICIM